MRKKAVFPGSFDPFTRAHYELCCEASRFFDITILICSNPHKNSGLFTVDERKDIIEHCIDDSDTDRIKVEIWDGLTTDYCDANEIEFAIRGIDYGNAAEELDLANIYYDESRVKTVFFPTYRPEHKNVRSSRVREYITKGGSWQKFVPKECIDKINECLIKRNLHN